MREIIIKSFLFILFLSGLLKVLDYYNGQFFIQAILLVVLSFVFSFIESKVIRRINKIVKKKP
jgi:ABC-type bacteriocin/lantibiotic exporter with double-glycine peptidase domain